MSTLLKTTALASLLILSACDTEQSAQSTDGGAQITYPDFEALFTDSYATPFKNGDIDAWMRIFADDAVALHNRREADVGKAAIESFGQMVAQYFKVDEFDVSVDEVRTSGIWAFTRGTYISNLLSRETGEPAPWGREKGKFFLLWELQQDKSWKVIVDMGNSIGPADDTPIETLQNKNKKVVARIIEEVLNQGNYALIDELLSDGLVEHDPHQDKGRDAKEAFKAAVQGFKIAFPDGQTIIESQIAEGDMVVTRWRMMGTHQGPFMGVAPTGRRVEMTGMFYDRVKDGQLHETWSNWDLFGLIQQLR